MSIVAGLPTIKGNSEVIDSFPLPLDSEDVPVPVQPGTPAIIDSDGTLIAADDDSKLIDGIAGPVNADGCTQALIRCGIGVGVVIEEGLETAIGEVVYLDVSTGQLTNDPDVDSLAVPQNLALNANFASESDAVTVYDPLTKADLDDGSYEGALIDFPGGLK